MIRVANLIHKSNNGHKRTLYIIKNAIYDNWSYQTRGMFPSRDQKNPLYPS